MCEMILNLCVCVCVCVCRYSGVFEAVKIRKQGFPFRLTHREFWLRYKCIMPRTHPWGKNMVQNCRFLIDEMKQDTSAVQIGQTRLLYAPSLFSYFPQFLRMHLLLVLSFSGSYEILLSLILLLRAMFRQNLERSQFCFCQGPPTLLL